MKRKKTLGILFGSIVLMAFFISIFHDRQKQTKLELIIPDDTGKVNIIDLDHLEDIYQINIKHTDYIIKLENIGNGEFYPVHSSDKEFSRYHINRIVSRVLNLRSLRIIKDVSDFSDFGLEEASVELAIITVKGDTLLYYIGKKNPAGDSYYIRKKGENLVYLVRDVLITPFFTTLDEFRDRSIISINPVTLQRIEIKTLESRNIEVVRIDNSNNDPEFEFTRFITTKPYERNFETNPHWIEDFFRNLNSLQIVRYVSENSEDLTNYGFDSGHDGNRLLLQDDNSTLEILFGNKTGDGWYARYPGIPGVFIMQGVDSVLSVHPFDTISPFVLIMNIDKIERFEVRTPDTVFVVRNEIKDDENNFFYLNDQEIEKSLFQSLYKWVIGLQFDAEFTALNNGKKVVSISYYLFDSSDPRAVSFVSENVNYYSVVREEISEFLISRGKIDRVLQEFEKALREVKNTG